MQPGSVAIILVNWNGYELTKKCLQSLRQTTFSNKEIIVVDNHSTDKSVSLLKSEFSEVTYIQNEQNLGFTGGNNVGMSYALDAGFDYIMLLNNDTEVNPDFIEPLLDKLQSNKGLGAVQPKINFVHDRSMIWNAGGRFNKWTGISSTIGYLDHSDSFNDSKEVDWITGCCILIPSNVLQEVGLLDDRFFAYHEDVDLSLRLTSAGYKLWYEPSSVVYHVAGASGKSKKKGKEGYLSPILHLFHFRNQIYVFRKHLNLIQMLSAMILLIGRLWAYCLYFILKGRMQKLRCALKGFKQGLFTRL